ncbi:hypothetical protein D3C78_20680 [compost metagenome]
MKYDDFLAIVKKYYAGEFVLVDIDQMGPSVPNPDQIIQNIEGYIRLENGERISVCGIGLCWNIPEDIEEHVRRQIVRPESVDKILVLKDACYDAITTLSYGAITVRYNLLHVIKRDFYSNSVEIIWKNIAAKHYQNKAYTLQDGELCTMMPTNWMQNFITDHDFYKNPNNQHLQNSIQFMSKEPIYIGSNIWVYSVEIWFMNAGAFWIPTNQQWVLNNMRVLPEHLKNEIHMILNMV